MWVYVEMICVGETSWLNDLLLFVTKTFMIYVRNFACREVSVKVGVTEFGL